MNELQQLPDMTLEEAQTEHAELKALEGIMRSKLLRMRDRKGWKALGFSSWEDYGEKEWNYGRQYLDRLATAARIENVIAPIGASDISETHLRPFAKIPESEISAIWEEANRKAEEAGKERTAKMVQEAVDEWKTKNKTLQSSLENYQTLYSESSRQRDQLRDNQAQIIEAKVSEEKAKLILENSNAIAQVEREAENAKAEIERLKKDQAKAIKDGVFSEIQKRKTEIDQLEYRCESLQKQTTDLSNARNLLEKENGIVKQHLESISTIGEAIQDIKSALYLAEERGAIPVELINEWSALNYALSGVSKEFVAFCNRENHVINGDILISNLSDLGRTLDSEAIFS